MFFDHHDGVVDHEAVPIVKAISDRLSRLKPEKYMMPKLVISDSGSATPAIQRARNGAGTAAHERDQHPLRIRVNCTSRRRPEWSRYGR